MTAPLARALDAESSWRRPLPVGWAPRDAALAVAMFAAGAVGLELARSAGGMDAAVGTAGERVWLQYLLLAAAAALLPLRRRFPVTVGVLATVHLLVASTLAPTVAAQTGLQVLYFVAVYSAAAWAPDRRALTAAVVGVSVVFALWSAWYWALGSGLDVLTRLPENAADAHPGPLPPVAAMLLYYSLINIAFFAGATALGAAGWRSARRSARLNEQAELIARQAEELRTAAVVEERLRIARELHDVVAHHIAAIGVQAGAARRNLPRRPELVGPALQAVEQSSRQAVTEMRSLLGTLRGTGPGGTDGGGADDAAVAAPEPTVTDLPALVDGVRAPGFTARLLPAPDPGLPPEAVPAAMGLSLYRITQEALANVRRHSTARSATVALRTRAGAERWVEVEVVDDGRPRAGTSGTGHGLQGIRERVASFGGECEIGPRAVGGYRVRARLPIAGGAS